MINVVFVLIDDIARRRNKDKHPSLRSLEEQAYDGFKWCSVEISIIDNNKEKVI